jgi:hypothetical protein
MVGTGEQLLKEIEDRLNYFYLQTDGTMNFPNSAEGDILKLVFQYINKEQERLNDVNEFLQKMEIEKRYNVILGKKDTADSNTTIWTTYKNIDGHKGDSIAEGYTLDDVSETIRITRQM